MNSDTKKRIVNMYLQGFAPSQIDEKLMLAKGCSRQTIIEEWMLGGNMHSQYVKVLKYLYDYYKISERDLRRLVYIKRINTKEFKKITGKVF